MEKTILMLITALLFCVLRSAAQAEIDPVSPELFVRLKRSKPDTNRVNLLLEIGGNHLQFTHVPRAHLDSAMVYAERAIKLSKQLQARDFIDQSLTLKGYVLIRMNRQKEGTTVFQQAINDYKNWPNLSREAETWVTLADLITSDSQKNTGIRLTYYYKADSIYRKLNNKTKSVETQKRIADVYLQAGQFNEAEKRLLLVIKQLRANHYRNLHYTYDLLAATARLQGDIKKQLFYQFEIIKSMEATGDMEHAIEFYGHLANVYVTLKRHDQAEKYFAKALAARSSHFYLVYFYGYLIFSADNLLAENKVQDAITLLKAAIKKAPPVLIHDKIQVDQALGRCYYYSNQPALAKQYYLLSATKIDSAHRFGKLNDQEYFISNTNISSMLIAIKEFKYAAKFIKKVERTPTDLIDPVNMSSYELQQYAIDSAAGNFRSALGHYKKHVQIQDSVFNVIKTRKIDSLQFAYENRQKDQDISLKSKNIQVLTKLNGLQKSKVEQTMLIRNLVIVGSAILLLLAALLFKRYKKEKHTNALLEQQREEITSQNESLHALSSKQAALITEKEWLLKEIHHRVKNNLQIVTSLLNSHSVYLKDETALIAMAESRHRVQAMSLIHQKLYNSENITDVYMPEYIGELVDYLKESFQIRQSVYVDLRVDKIRLDVASAVPLGLILNEVITNAFKYAFPEKKDNKLVISLTQADQEINLSVVDNGIGFPSNFDIQSNKSFGMTLIRGMAGDLEGTVSISQDNGVQISLSFINSLTNLHGEKV